MEKERGHFGERESECETPIRFVRGSSVALSSTEAEGVCPQIPQIWRTMQRRLKLIEEEEKAMSVNEPSSLLPLPLRPLRFNLLEMPVIFCIMRQCVRASHNLALCIHSQLVLSESMSWRIIRCRRCSFEIRRLHGPDAHLSEFPASGVPHAQRVPRSCSRPASSLRSVRTSNHSNPPTVNGG